MCRDRSKRILRTEGVEFRVGSNAGSHPPAAVQTWSCPPDAWAAASPTAKWTLTQRRVVPGEIFLCLLQRGRERGSCSIKPSSTVPLDCPICLDINTHSHTHSLMHAHAPSVVLSVTHGKLHTQWGLSRRRCAFSDVLCEGETCCQLCLPLPNTICGIFLCD